MRGLYIIPIIAFIAFGFRFGAESNQRVYDQYKSDDDTSKYIFLGHIYDYFPPSGYRVDPRIEELILDPYARVWLGGDVLSEATLDRENFIYLDSLFNLSDSSTQYALGNHDLRNANIQYYREFTGRKSFNVYSKNGAVTICMNTQLNPSMCEDLNDQFDMIKNVCDTIQDSKHLFLIMHNCLFFGVPNIPDPVTFAHSDFSKWNANCESSTNTFTTAIYPLLEQVRDRGISVYCIMGDAGDNEKKFYAEATDSIHFFASGIVNSKYTDSAVLATKPKDLVLVFEHVLPSQEMIWNFRDLDSLIDAQ